MDNWGEDVDRRINYALGVGRVQGIIKPNDPVLVITGSQPGEGNTSTIRVIITPENRPIRVMNPPSGSVENLD